MCVLSFRVALCLILCCFLIVSYVNRAALDEEHAKSEPFAAFIKAVDASGIWPNGPQLKFHHLKELQIGFWIKDQQQEKKIKEENKERPYSLAVFISLTKENKQEVRNRHKYFLCL